MNEKKKMNIKRPNFSESLEGLKKKCAPLIEVVAPYWSRLPKFHQTALRALIPVTCVLVLLPHGTTEETDSIQPTMIPVDEMQRQSISLNLEGLSEQEGNLNETSSSYDTAQEKKIAKLVEKTKPIEKAPSSIQGNWQNYKIKAGDTLYQVFRKNNLPLTELNKLVKIEGTDKPLSNIKKGQLFRFKLDSQGDLDIVQIERDGQAVTYFRLSDGNFGRSK